MALRKLSLCIPFCLLQTHDHDSEDVHRENTLPEKSYVIGWTPSRLGDSWESNILEEMLVIHNEINRV